MSIETLEPKIEHVDPSVVTESAKPINNLPEVGSDVVVGDEFWSRRNLRPDTGGPNFHNFPVFRFGVSYESGQAILSVPTVDYLNGVVREYNPGGFQFRETKGFLHRREFLKDISQKIFPQSVSADEDIGESSEYLKYTYRKEKLPWLNLYIPTNLREHDMAGHSGIAILPAGEADKVSALALSILKLDMQNHTVGAPDLTEPQLNHMTAYLDLLLTKLSEYVTIPSHGSQEDESFKKYLRTQILEIEARSSVGLTNLLKEIGVQGVPEPFDFDAIDANVKRMQTIGQDEQKGQYDSSSI